MQSPSRHRITIEAPAQVQDPDTLNVVDSWAPVTGFVRIAADVYPGRGAEFFAARQIQATQTAEVHLRYQPGITQAMRLVHHVRPGQDVYYDIVGMTDFQGRQKELRLMCTARDGEGWRRGTDLTNSPVLS